MKNYLVIFAGSTGHFTGFHNFLKTISYADNVKWASHLNLPANLKQNISFHPIKSYPAFVNYEFLLDVSLPVKVQLKAKSTFYHRRKQELKILIDRVKPDVIILDNYVYTDALILAELYRNSTIRILLYQTRLSTTLDSKSQYGRPWFKNFKWLKGSTILRRQRFDRIVNQVGMPGFSDESNVKKLIQQLELQNVTLNRNRYGLPSLTYLPELILSGMDLSNYHAANQYYMGLGIKSLISGSKSVGQKKIMISIGSRDISTEIVSNYLKGIQKLVRSVKGVQFFIPEALKSNISDSHVSYYSWDNYHDHLAQSDLHITHGGINSIKDSMSCGVPMLISPLDWKSDQIHNALMFEKIGLARTWNVKKDSLQEIRLKIEELLEGDFKERIKEYVEEDRRRYPVEKVREQFQELLKDERWEVRNW